MFEITNPYPGVITYMKRWPTKLGCLQTSVEIRDVSMDACEISEQKISEQRSGSQTM